jgi:hypothetical protein
LLAKTILKDYSSLLTVTPSSTSSANISSSVFRLNSKILFSAI